MPEILPDHVPSPRTPLVWDGNRYRAVRGDPVGRVQVRGENQLFSYREALHDRVNGNPSGADGYFQTVQVPAGEVHHVTHINVMDVNTAVTGNQYIFRGVAFDRTLKNVLTGAGIGVWVGIDCDLWLDATDRIRVYFYGCLAGDTVYIDTLGHVMSLEV